MKDLLQQFLGSNPQKQQEYADFLQRYQNDPGSISNEEAARRYRELMKNAPQGLADEANQHAFEQVPQQERHDLADQFQDATKNPARPFDGYNHTNPAQGADPRNLGRMTQQAENQDPDLFDQLFGSNSPLSSPLGKAALAAGAAYLASRVLSGQGLPGVGSNAQQGQGSGPLGGLGGLLGGSAGGLGGLLGGNTGGNTGGTGVNTGSTGGSAGDFDGGQQQGADIPGVNLPDSSFDKQT